MQNVLWESSDSSVDKIIEKINSIKEYQYMKQKEIKRLEYEESLIFEDLVRVVKQPKNRFDYISHLFKSAWQEQNAKYKKDKQTYNLVKNFINKNFYQGENLKQRITACGLDCYAYSFECEYRGYQFSIQIPVLDNITITNIEYTHNGMILLYEVHESCHSLLLSSYKIEDICDMIQKLVREEVD